MLLQPENSDFITNIIKEVKAHEYRSRWTLKKIVMSTIITKIIMEISRLVYPFSISSVRDYQMED